MHSFIHRPVAVQRRSSQRGSALLIVLVFAAIVAIMLYREMPVAAFEAQRQKEELLVSRGNEYKRGVKLFVRKIGRFPSSIDELENTNRMRFLRHRYVDPLTGKDDWRLIHAGPGGIITDSQVKDKSAAGNSANALGQAAVFAGFNNSFSGDVAAIADAAPVSAALRQRAPATKNAASAQTDSFGMPLPANEPGNEDPNAPVAPGGQAGQPNGGGFNSQPAIDPATGQAIPNNAPGNTAQNANAQALNGQGAGNGIGSVAQQLNNVNPKANEQAQTPATGFGNTSAFGNSTNPTQGVGNNGQIMGAGGIAGVASKAKGKSIKTVNDQTKYPLWEFYYDMRKDQNSGAAGFLQNANGNGVNGNNANGAGVNGNTNSGFGSNNNSAFGSNGGGGFGSSSGFGQTQQQGQSQSGFGSSSTQQTQPQSSQPNPPQ